MRTSVVRFLLVAMVIFTMISASFSFENAKAVGDINITPITTDPVKVGVTGNIILRFTNVSTVTKNGFFIVYTKPPQTAFKVPRYFVSREFSSTPICSFTKLTGSARCFVGKLNPGESVVATVTFYAKRARSYWSHWEFGTSEFSSSFSWETIVTK